MKSARLLLISVILSSCPGTNDSPPPAIQSGFLDVPEVIAGPTSVALTWKAPRIDHPQGDGLRGIITAYTLYWQDVATSHKFLNSSGFVSLVDTASANKKIISMGNGATRYATLGIEDGLETDKTYECVLTATFPVGESPPSRVFLISFDDDGKINTPPSETTNLIVNAGNKEVFLTWKEPDDKGKIFDPEKNPGFNAKITRYTIFYSTSPIEYLYDDESITTQKVTAGSNGVVPTEFNLRGLENYVDYYFAVSASNDYFMGRALSIGDTSGGVMAKPIPYNRIPGAPGNVLANPGDAEVQLSWHAPADLGIIGNRGIIGTILQYKVYFSKTNNFTNLNRAEITSLTTTGLTLKVIGLENDVPYYFIVNATNGTGTSRISTVISATPRSGYIPNTVPGAPSIGTLSPGKGSISISWEIPRVLGTINNDGTEGILSEYKVYYSNSERFTPGGATGSIRTDPDKQTADIANLTPEKMYYFLVTASNATGEGIPSDIAGATPLILDDEAVARATENLEIIFAPGESHMGVTQNMTLSNTGIEDTTVTWVSSDESVISNDGTVFRPLFTEGDVTLTLTATIERNGVQQIKEFEVTVLRGESDLDSVYADKVSLNINYLATDSPSRVTLNLDLPNTGSYGSVITWESSDESVITTYGRVIRPSQDTPVTLTAKITRGSESIEKVFALTVKSASSNSTAPQEVNNIQVSPGNEKATVSWEAPTDFGTTDGIAPADILAYVIVYNEKNNEMKKKTLTILHAMEIATGTAIVKGLINEVLYEFNVYAVNNAGQSSSLPTPAVESTPTLVDIPVSQAANLAVVANGWTKNAITLRWDVASAGVKNKTYASVTEYRVYHSTTELELNDLSQLTGLTGELKTTVSVSNLEPGTEYFFVVETVTDINGNSISSVFSTHTNSNPSEPTLSGTPGTAEVVLVWTASQGGWKDGIRASIHNYEIYRELSEISDLTGLTPIHTTTDSTPRQYTDSKVTTGETYYYAIVAVTDINGKSLSSGGTNSVTVNE